MSLPWANAFIDPSALLGCSTHDDETCTELNATKCLSPPWGSDGPQADWFFGMIEVLTLMGLYAYILSKASNMLSEGSELLLLVPSLSGLVGSVVLPILGAVPDGAIMLFSGLGPPEQAQQQLTIGVGALAGSTIMLLTIPWGAAIFAGRVAVGPDGNAKYKVAAKRAVTAKDAVAAKLGSTHGAGVGAALCGTGVTPGATIRTNAFLMLATSLVYLVIQGPALQYAEDNPSTEAEKWALDQEIHKKQQWWALVGLILAVGAFGAYLYIMVQQASQAEVNQHLIDNAIIKNIKSGSPITLSGVLAPLIEAGRSGRDNKVHVSTSCSSNSEPLTAGQQGSGRHGSISLQAELLSPKDRESLATVLAPFFGKYDEDGDGALTVHELRQVLNDLGERVTEEQARAWMERLDTDNSGTIERAEFVEAMIGYVARKVTTTGLPDLAEGSGASAAAAAAAGASGAAAEDDEGEGEGEGEGEEELEVPDDFKEMSWQEQQSHIKRRAAWEMGVGTLLIVIFSDPMVDVMSNMGDRCSIPPFYIAFVLAPLASNASEFIASYSYAQKKTQKTITVSLAALEGAACMNNTFCLAIFMGVSRRARAPRARARPRPRPRSPSLCTRTRTRTRRDACLERSRGWPCPATARHAHPPPSCADRPPARTRHDPSASVSQLVFFKQLAWKYSAETITTLVVQVIVGCVALRPTMPLWIALALLALFPASIVMIAALEAIGLD